MIFQGRRNVFELGADIFSNNRKILIGCSGFILLALRPLIRVRAANEFHCHFINCLNLYNRATRSVVMKILQQITNFMGYLLQNLVRTSPHVRIRSRGLFSIMETKLASLFESQTIL